MICVPLKLKIIKKINGIYFVFPSACTIFAERIVNNDENEDKQPTRHDGSLYGPNGVLGLRKQEIPCKW